MSVYFKLTSDIVIKKNPTKYKNTSKGTMYWYTVKGVETENKKPLILLSFSNYNFSIAN